MKGQSLTCTYHLLPFYPTACSAGGSAHEGPVTHLHLSSVTILSNRLQRWRVCA